MKIRFLIIILTLVVVQTAYASKGKSGSYLLKFIMFDRKSDNPIQDAIFIINNDTLKSDSNGIALYEFKWATICPSVVPPPMRWMKVRRENRQQNCNITLKYSGHAVKTIKSYWKRYGLHDARTVESPPVEVYVKW